MCGMKTGAGEDPFADETGDDESEETGTSTSGPDRRDRSSGRSAGNRSRSGPGRRGRGGSREHEESDADGRGDRIEPSDLPFIARRNARGDNIKAGRDKRRLFELRPDVAEREGPFLEELERQIGREVPKTDAREAALAVVYDRPELVAEKLEEWGINYFDG